MAVRRDPPQDVQWRAGHTTSTMTEQYITNARYEAGATFGTPLAELPTSLLVPPSNDVGSVAEEGGKVLVRVSDIGRERPQKHRQTSGGAGNRTRVRKFRGHLRLRAYPAV